MSPVQSLPPTVTIATPNSNLNSQKYITPTTRPRKTMSDALSISNITQKQMAYDTLSGSNTGSNAGAVSVEQSAVAAVAAAYQYGYSQLYADRTAAAAMYAPPPIMFSAPTHPVLTVAAPVPAHANYKYNGGNDSNTVFSAAYFKAIQNAVNAGIFSPTQVPPASPTIPAPTLTPPTPTLSKSPTLIAAPAPTTKVHSGGTYLNERAFNAKATEAEVNYFKVPSGKEGSLKHRILTRPQNNLQSAQSNNCQTLCSNEDINHSATVMRTYETTSNFRRGSYIELANGVLRKVEDMRTEDFIQCAERSPHHKLAESTVVKIDLTPVNTVVITFSYDNNRSRADVEVSQDHPFFVYGQGWASYNTEASIKLFGLKCQRLQVGDICISLIKRDEPAKETATSQHNSNATAINMTVTAATTSKPANTTDNMRFQLGKEYTPNVLPLSPHTPPAQLVSTSNHLSLPTLAAAHFAAAPPNAVHNIPFHLLSNHLNPYSADMTDLVSAYAYHAHINPNAANTTTGKVLNSYYAPPPHVYHNDSQSKDAVKLGNADVLDYKHHYHACYESLGPPSATALSLAHDTHYLHSHHHHHHHQQQQQQQQQHQHLSTHTTCEDEPVDATIAKKRRWSAPEGVSDEEEQKRQVMQHMGESGMYKIFKPSPVVATAPSLLGSTPI